MRNRLIELIGGIPWGQHTFEQCFFKSTVEKIADTLIEKGVIIQPCKIGDTIYDISEFVNCVPCPEMYEDKVSFITIMNRENGEMYFDIECVECDYEDFGKTIFLTKEEAEKALEERNGATDVTK